MKQRSQPLILASSSPFRRELLGKLGLAFDHHSPDIDESARPGETPTELVLRLARAKAAALAHRHPDALIIGSDQVAVIDGEVLGKPGDRDTAVAQLRRASGRTVTFLTGLCLLNAETGRPQSACERFTVHFRHLRDTQIERYIEVEQPLNCAGSFKSEGLGIVLFKSLEGRDPNALVGLPLILLTDFLAAEGVALPA
ncbi:MAG: septum formation inhibitor Maf [Alcanivorax sp.]|nr:septum formation inhibitor Maf [Alcanivorax sp.]MBI55759.1 septum formation inhibitor Maf [Alcanivorax sp.]MBM1143979.1 septum formation inhibitor Maf [Alcanivorax sp. ZXX171]MBU57591.1 septum formation inhibitor Maf [Alcanivorax sp.]HCE39848.1 septum formation inhibitor Maf [Alcanivorax sp.]|tara:strand:- start:116 stop:709 length:594 start_codon:yes stop_codon:yes gene_type:complete